MDLGHYDQPIDIDGDSFVDDDHELPYRHLKYWYIYKRNMPEKRCALPNKVGMCIPSDFIFAGWLQPPSSSNLEPVFVKLDNVKLLTMDRVRTGRGYWVQTFRGKTPLAWYWLQEPCDAKPSPDVESQAELQFEANVILTCVSLFCDKILTVENALRNVHKSVETILQESSLLFTDNDKIAKHLSEFEMNILSKYKSQVKQHLVDCVVECTEGCKFMKSMSKIRRCTYQPSKVAMKLWNFLLSQQLNQYLWGGTIPNSQGQTLQDDVDEVMETAPSNKKLRKISDTDQQKKRKSYPNAETTSNGTNKPRKCIQENSSVENNVDADLYSAVRMKRIAVR
jgi:hypothetical protein